MAFKKIVCFDFDGVIHSYTSKWVDEVTIPDPPVAGIREEIQRIREGGYKVVVFSSRCKTVAGRLAINKYLRKWGIIVDEICGDKPPAFVTIDDRAICFSGSPKNLLEQINSFVPWNKEEPKPLFQFDLVKALEDKADKMLKEENDPTLREILDTVPNKVEWLMKNVKLKL